MSSLFDTCGKSSGQEGRKPNTLLKLERMNRALRHEEPDRVPISDFFWGGFIRRWREELGLPADASPYYHYDLDFIAFHAKGRPRYVDDHVQMGIAAQLATIDQGFRTIAEFADLRRTPIVIGGPGSCASDEEGLGADVWAADAREVIAFLDEGRARARARGNGSGDVEPGT